MVCVLEVSQSSLTDGITKQNLSSEMDPYKYTGISARASGVGKHGLRARTVTETGTEVMGSVSSKSKLLGQIWSLHTMHYVTETFQSSFPIAPYRLTYSSSSCHCHVRLGTASPKPVIFWKSYHSLDVPRSSLMDRVTINCSLSNRLHFVLCTFSLFFLVAVSIIQFAICVKNMAMSLQCPAKNKWLNSYL